MNIKIVDSWLKEYLKTSATTKTIAEKLSLTSVSIEKIEKDKNDSVYEVEVTSNRPDLMSVVGIAREASVVLPQFGIQSHFHPIPIKKPNDDGKPKLPIDIKSDPKLVNRICAVLMEVEVKESPDYVKERLEISGIRSLNNLIDITNYVMRETGHPCHVFDADRLGNTIIIRESRKGEKITTLDGKTHTLQGGDIVADNGKGEIVDLLGVMGTENSVVTEKTKRVLFFLDNNEPHHIRRTSMSLGIRTEAAVLNEKGVDPELATQALYRGIELYHNLASGKLLAKIEDIYPNKPKLRQIAVNKQKINQVIGIEIPVKTSIHILTALGFEVMEEKEFLNVNVPSWRLDDVEIPEDVIEEIARVYGYFQLPSILPPLTKVDSYHIEKNEFFWEKRIKDALKYWGFTEVYTYSMVSEDILESAPEDGVELVNPLNEELKYLRTTLTPSLLEILKENKGKEEIKIFEIANTYLKREGDLPNEERMISSVIQKPNASFFETKGIIEQLFADLGIKQYKFKESQKGGLGASIFINKKYAGDIEVLDNHIVDFELEFETIVENATLKKIYKPIAKYPPVIEDISLLVQPETKTGDIIEEIYKQSELIKEVSLLDQFKESRTFHIVYQSPNKNLTNEEVAKIRQSILKKLEETFEAKLKSQ